MITDRHEELWLLAATRTAKRVQRHPTTEEIEDEYAVLLGKFILPDGSMDTPMPPKDPSLRPIWDNAALWVHRNGEAPTDTNTRKFYDRFLELYTEPDGRVNPDKEPFPYPITEPYEFPGMPGLTVRRATLDDVPTVVATLVERGNYPEPRATTRITDAVTHPLAWAFMWEWNGAPLQFESFYVGAENRVYLGYTVHFTRERSHWFWRETERPVWEWLRERGVTYISSLLRADRQYWLRYLKANYKAEVLNETEHRLHLRFDLTDLDSIFKGWPARKTAGPDWKWEHPESELTIREMDESELESIKSELAVQWRSGFVNMKCGPVSEHPRLPLVRRLLDEQYHLDRSTILVARRGQTLVGVFSIRSKQQPGACHITSCGRDTDPETDLLWRVVYKGVCEWAYTVGYHTMKNLVPEDIWAYRTKRQVIRHTRGEVTGRRRFKRPFVEVTRDLDAIHTEPVSAWEQWDATRPELPESMEAMSWLN